MATHTQCALDLLLVTNTRNGMYGGYKLGLLDRELTTLEKKIVLCTQCNGILRDPISVESKLKCRSCLEPSESGEPSESARIGITESLKVICPFKYRGCDWIDSIANIIDHKKNCQHFLDTYPSCTKMDLECNLKRYDYEVVTQMKHMEHHESVSQTKHLQMMAKHIKNSDVNLKKIGSELAMVNCKLHFVKRK